MLRDDNLQRSCDGKLFKKLMTAIKNEIDCLRKTNTWDVVEENEAKVKEAMTNKWVLRKKDDGTFKSKIEGQRACAEKSTELR